MSPATASERPKARRVALVTHGFWMGGGVPVVARWLRDALIATGQFDVDVHDLATWRHDPASRRIMRPSTWLRRSVADRAHAADGIWHWGANAVEIEFARYRPRRELCKALANYDLIQVVCGAAAWAFPTARVRVPKVLLVATTVAREREYPLSQQSGHRQWWSAAMTRVTTRIESEAARHAAIILAQNDELAAEFRATGHPRVLTAFPGVDIRRFSPSRDGWDRDGHLLSVCRLSDPRKRLDLMVRAYAECVRRDPAVPDLLLAGDGAVPKALQRTVQTLGLSDRVIVRANVAPADLVELYRHASVFLQTSYEEGLGLSVLEAMACGLPVVTTATAGTRQTVVDSVTGWLIPQATPGELVPLIADRLGETRADCGSRMGDAARTRCERFFSSDVALSRITRAYDALLPPG